MSIERRRFPRINVHIIPDEMYPIGGAEIIPKRGEIINLSIGGVAIDTKELFRVGDNVYLTFSLPNGARISEVYAHLIRVEEKEGQNYLGVRFLNLSDSYRESIREFIKTQIAPPQVPGPQAVDMGSVKIVKKRKKEKSIYKTAFRKPKRNKEFLQAVQSGMEVKALMDKFHLSESGISMLKKRLMKRDISFRQTEKRFRSFNLKKYRKLKGMTQDKLAKELGVRRETITRWEKKLFEPSDSYKWKILKILGSKKS